MCFERLHGALAARVVMPQCHLAPPPFSNISMNSIFQIIPVNPLTRSVIRALGLIAATTQIILAEDAADPAKSEIAELRQQVQDLTKLVKDLQQQVAARPAAAPAARSAHPVRPSPTHDSKAVISTPAPATSDLTGTTQADPLSVPKRSDLSLFNPEISAVIDIIGSYSASANNFNITPRDIELMIQANVDQLAHAYVVFNAESELDPWTKTDPFGEVSLGVEEAAIETTALPYGLGVKAGLFFADFSRLGKVHSHELPFTDRPASLEGILGGETKARGVELSWVPPVGHYFRFTAGAVDNIGAETAATGLFTTLGGDEENLFANSDHRSFSDLTYYGRAATIFELGGNTTLNVGLDYAYGREQGTRQLASADFKLTWLPDAASFNRLEIGGEVLRGKNSGAFGPDAIFAGSPTHGDSTAKGAYIYAQYRIGKNWEPGVRYDWFRPECWSQSDSDADGTADGMARSTQSQNSLSAYLTYNLSEYNRLRFAVSHINGESGSFNGKDDDWLGYLQWTAILGAHKHSFQP
jgi:hypothetical protein